MKKRVLSMLLVVIMTIGMIPVYTTTVTAAESQWLWPVPDCYIVSSNYGWRDLDGNGTLEDQHKGIDIVGANGTFGKAIVASKSGSIYGYCNTFGDEQFKSGSYGNYVIINHEDGTYSIYGHMKKNVVKTSGKVKQGDVIGYIGNSGESYGSHLHFQIFTNPSNMNGSTLNPMPTNSKITIRNVYSLPSGWSANKITYTFETCQHSSNKNLYNSVGVCTICKAEFDFGATFNANTSGIYKVTLKSGIDLRASKPYSDADKNGVHIDYGTQVEVLGSVKNHWDHEWCKVSYNGKTGYTSKDNLTFVGYGAQSITGSITSPYEGQVLPKKAYPVKGTITSKYPLKEIKAYLDGSCYATVSGQNKTSLELQPTDVNNLLDFAKQTPGSHTIVIKARDIHHSDYVTVCTRKFVTEGTVTCSHSYSSSVTVEATCTDEGVRTYKCSKCGSSYTESISPSGHDWSKWYENYPATEYYEGEEYRYCSFCGDIEYRTTPQLDPTNIKYSVEGGYIYFNKLTGTITDCDTSVTSVNIPASINGASVTSIGDVAFQFCESLTSISIPNSVTSIGMWAFDACESLTSINLPDSITNINHGAFTGCHSLKSITLPNGITSLPDSMLYDCTSLTSVTIPDSVTSLGSNVFSFCTSLKEITIPDGVTVIDSLFSNCTSLTSVSIPNSVTRIEMSTFYNCNALTDVYYSGTQSEWNSIYIDDLFNDSLFNATIHFAECDHDYYISSSLKATCVDIGYTTYTCRKCADSYTEYDYSAPHIMGQWNVWTEPTCGTPGLKYRMCTECAVASEEEEIPATGDHEWDNWYVKSWHGDQNTKVRRDCVKCSVYEENSVMNVLFSYPVTGGNIYFDKENGTVLCADATVSYVEMPSYIDGVQVKAIGKRAFADSALSEVVIPEGVEAIGDQAFLQCTRLTRVYLPGTLTSIGEDVFENCYILTGSLAGIYYSGSESDWNNIQISEPNDYLNKIYIRFSSDTGCEHVWSSWRFSGSPCENDTVKFRECVNCGAVETNNISATGHNWSGWSIINPANCEKDGSEGRECQYCGKFETKIVPAVGHTYGDWITVKEPTAASKGEKIRKCQNCDVTETEEIDELGSQPSYKNPFTDVKDGQWYTDGILWCYENEYMAGVSDTEFGRKDNVTRAMFATILAKIDGSDISDYSKMSFTDVKPNQWYSNAIEWAASNGYAAGLGEGIFGYKQNVSREQIALFFYTYSSKNGIDVSAEADLNGYADLNRVHSWALDAVEWAVAKGLISGTSETTLSPRDSATRAEIALIVKNYVETVKG